MNIVNRVRESLANFIKPTQTNSGLSLARRFLRKGSKDVLYGDWSDIRMLDEDYYKGYGYAAIRTRANAVARIALNNVYTDAKKELKEKDEDLIHPYLEVIDKSRSFANTQFWRDISTYLDLQGIYYLMVIRAIEGERIGTVKEFKLLNPYNIQRIVNQETLEVGGYRETRGGLVREIPKELIIEIRELNPLDNTKPFSISDASKSSQFALRTMNDYTNHSLKKSINAPGIIATDIIMETEAFDNFVEKVKSREKGAPIFGNGSGAIKWQDMQMDLNKSALEKVNEVNREQLMAISGVSKTILGIEQSGTTRETAKVQKDLYYENHIIPRIELITEALNQDFKNYYTIEYDKTGYYIKVENPNSTDYDADIKQLEIKKTELDLFTSMIKLGYNEEVAGQYIEGKTSIDEIGEPENEVAVEQSLHSHCEDCVRNDFTEEQQGIIGQQQSALKNAILNIQRSLVASCITKITKNQFESEEDIVYKTDKKEAVQDLDVALKSFYAIVLTLEGKRWISKRVNELNLQGSFNFSKLVKDWTKKSASKVAESHIDTVLKDILVEAQQLALKGASRDEIVSKLKSKYADKISKQRAETIARTETNRAFTQAHFEADKQFIKQNDLEIKAYKKWTTRSSNPCAFCQHLANQPAIPFNTAFAKIGQDITVSEEIDGEKVTRTLPINFMDLEAGNAHVNCSCSYVLVLEP